MQACCLFYSQRRFPCWCDDSWISVELSKSADKGCFSSAGITHQLHPPTSRKFVEAFDGIEGPVLAIRWNHASKEISTIHNRSNHRASATISRSHFSWYSMNNASIRHMDLHHRRITRVWCSTIRAASCGAGGWGGADTWVAPHEQGPTSMSQGVPLPL